MIESLQELTGEITQSQELTGELDRRVVGGKVDDVQVNGTSVVENKIANIDLTGKQDLLVSGTNIKTINNNSILGSGDIEIGGGGSSTDVQINGTSITNEGIANILTNTAYDSSTNKIATMSDIPNISAKYYINGDYLIYNVSGGNYNITPNSTSNITKTRLPLNEIVEAIELAYTNDKYLILNIYTTANGGFVNYVYSTKFNKISSSQNEGFATYINFTSGNLWSAALTLPYGFSSGEWYVNAPNCRGEQQRTIGMNNDNVYTPSSPYNVCTKKYVDDNIVKIQYSTMPTANANNVGQIVQYVGTTSGLYVNGFLYKCVEYTTGSYRWEYINGEYEFEPTARVNNLRQDTAFQENIRKMLLMNKQSAMFQINLTSGDNNGHNGIQVVRIAQNIKNHPTTINIYTTTIAYYSFTHFGYTGWEQTNATVTWTDNNPTITNMTTASGSDTDNMILTTKNTQSFTPTANYHPATKKYVDDIVGDIESLLGGI